MRGRHGPLQLGWAVQIEYEGLRHILQNPEYLVPDVLNCQGYVVILVLLELDSRTERRGIDKVCCFMRRLLGCLPLMMVCTSPWLRCLTASHFLLLPLDNSSQVCRFPLFGGIAWEGGKCRCATWWWWWWCPYRDGFHTVSSSAAHRADTCIISLSLSTPFEPKLSTTWKVLGLVSLYLSSGLLQLLIPRWLSS